jgi:carbon-monoxide dehydrogenase medium subunit
MKPASFGYVRPETLDEALATLGELGEEGKVLAGGQSLVPLMNMRLALPAWLIDIGRVEALEGWGRNGDSLQIGARVAQAEIEDAGGAGSPLLGDAIGWIGHRTVRNRGTVCGSLAHADPAAELPAVAVALGATMRLASVRGVREVPARDFFVAPLTTVVEADELLSTVEFRLWPEATGAVEEVARRRGDFALAGAAVALSWEDGRIANAGVSLFGAVAVPTAVAEAEAVLEGSRGEPEAVREAASAAARAARPTDDYHASADYRLAMAEEMTARALRRAVAARVGQVPG